MDNMHNMKNYLEDEHLTPLVRRFLKSIDSGGPGLEALPVADARNVLVTLQESANVDVSGIQEMQKAISMDGYDINLVVVRPQGSVEPLPAFLFIHGGGWVLGDYPTHKRLVRDIVVNSGMAAVFVEYTRTPEAQFPQAVNEIYAAAKWVSENGGQINVDPTKLAVVGNSVGGNMTAVTCLKAMQNGGPDIKLAVMMWPIVDADFDSESYRLFGSDRFLTTPLMKWMYDFYISDPEKRHDILASPLEASVEQLKGFPPALIQVAENDILRDGGEAFGRKLAEAGADATTVRYNGVIHDWGLLNGLASAPETRQLILQIASALKKYLK